MILFWILLILVVIFLVRKGLSNTGSQETAQEILKKRYVRGEISKEEYDRMKKDIKG